MVLPHLSKEYKATELIMNMAPMTHYDPYGLYSLDNSGWMLKDFNLGLKNELVSATSVFQGIAHGCVDFCYRNAEAFLWGFHFIGAGNISSDFLTHEERMAMHAYQAERMDKLSNWVESGTQNLLGINPNDIVYQNTRYATGIGLEAASYAYGGYTIGKGFLKSSMKSTGRLAKQSIKGGLRESSVPAALAQKGLKIENGLARTARQNEIGEKLFHGWNKGTFENRMQSLKYHYQKHGNGRGIARYTDDSLDFFAKNKHLGKEVILKNGKQGVSINFKPEAHTD